MEGPGLGHSGLAGGLCVCCSASFRMRQSAGENFCFELPDCVDLVPKKKKNLCKEQRIQPAVCGVGVGWGGSKHEGGRPDGHPCLQLQGGWH